MKVCPKCARSFADGFTYCPNDATGLVKYDLRAHLHSKPELKFLLKNDSLLTRLRRELGSAFAEFKRNPRHFLRSLFRGEGSNRRRRFLLHAGAATAIVSYATIALILALLGLSVSPISRRIATAELVDPFTRDGYKIELITSIPKEPAERKHSRGGIGGQLAQRRRAQGGGGGGDKTPARNGVPPAASLTEPLRSPSPEPPKLNNALLTIRESVFADPKSLLDLKGPVGLTGSHSTAPSMGDGPGTGVGPGKGQGYGPGEDAGTGGKKFAPGGGETTGPGNDDGLYTMSASIRPTILYKEKAQYTEEARQNRIQGVVVLNVTFGADSQLHDIRVIRGLPSGLTEKAIEAAGRIRFNPAQRNGKRINVRGAIEFNFTLY